MHNGGGMGSEMKWKLRSKRKLKTTNEILKSKEVKKKKLGSDS